MQVVPCSAMDDVLAVEHHLPPVSIRAHLHMQLSLSMSLVLKSAPWITRLLCRPAVPLWLFRNSLKYTRRKRRESGHKKHIGGGEMRGGGRGGAM